MNNKLLQLNTCIHMLIIDNILLKTKKNNQEMELISPSFFRTLN